jgi:hypothetical protein
VSDQDFKLLDELGAEFDRIAAAAEHRGGAFRAGRRTSTLVVALALIVAGGATAAVTGVFDADDPTSGLIGASNRQVLAEGTSPSGAGWHIITGTERGGVFCLSLRVDRPGGPGASANCGGFTPGTFAASTAAASDTRGLVFGTVPDQASQVQARTGDETQSAATVDDPAGLTGRFFVIEVPGDAILETTLAITNSRGEQIAEQPLRALIAAASPYD